MGDAYIDILIDGSTTMRIYIIRPKDILNNIFKEPLFDFGTNQHMRCSHIYANMHHHPHHIGMSPIEAYIITDPPKLKNISICCY